MANYMFVEASEVPCLPTRSTVLRLEEVGKDKAIAVREGASADRRIILADRGKSFADLFLKGCLPTAGPAIIVDLTPYVGNLAVSALEKDIQSIRNRDSQRVFYMALPRDIMSRDFVRARVMADVLGAWKRGDLTAAGVPELEPAPELQESDYAHIPGQEEARKGLRLLDLGVLQVCGEKVWP